MRTRRHALSPRALEARTEACRLLACHRLDDWSFRFNRSRVNLGLCLYGLRVIELSAHFVERNPPDLVRDTLLHEIAHGLAGRAAGHGPAWKAMCLRVGARPERLSFEADMPEGRWQARCGSCGMVHHKHRRPKRMTGWYCGRCGPERGRLAWVMQGPDGTPGGFSLLSAGPRINCP
jgi:predicted SprT family Zn-dependent metalloprotease